MNNYKIVYELNDKQIDDLMEIYSQNWWSKKRKKDDVICMLKNTTVVIGIIHNDKLIAFCRILSDFVYKALIFDVMVHKKYKNKGLGKRLLKEVFSYEKFKNVKNFELYCLDEMVLFYEKFGFKKINLNLLGKEV